MIAVSEADERIVAALPTGPVETVATVEAGGRVLRETVAAERPFPPFDRVMMDGIAVSAAAWQGGQRTFEHEGTAFAGQPARALRDPCGAIEVMTGAVLPTGTDLVIPVEQVQVSGSSRTVADTFVPPPGGFVHRKGSDAAAGAVLLSPGHRLDGRALGVAVSCGAEHLTVTARPRIALVSTGDELIDAGLPIQPHQIRRSNLPALAATLRLHGYTEIESAHLPDEAAALEAGLGPLLDRNDFVILNGGVSMGQRDLVPAALAALGVETRFHRVAQRPGKPLYFGEHGDTAVFGLPGNPVSTLVGLHRYILPSLSRWEGALPPAPCRVALGAAVSFPAPLTYYLPVVLDPETGEALPRPVANSGDFEALLHSDGFVELPADLAVFPVGYRARFFPW